MLVGKPVTMVSQERAAEPGESFWRIAKYGDDGSLLPIGKHDTGENPG